MTHIFLRQIACMVAFIVIGSLDLLIAPHYSKWWATMINALCGIICYVYAWWSYCDARKAAKQIDESLSALYEHSGNNHKLLNLILGAAFLSESTPEANTPEDHTHDDHEDIGHPV